VITISNSANPDNLKQSRPDAIQKVKDCSADLNWMASVYMRMSEFREYLHPEPSTIVQYLMLHEMGHFNGFSHNFVGSQNGTAQNPTDSIMEYIPFSTLVKPLKLGKLDHDLINLVYKHIQPPQDRPFCSDFDSTGGLPPNIRKEKANCNTFDVGDSAEWYILLSKYGEDGIFSNDPTGGVSLLTKLGRFLLAESGATEKQQQRVSEFLCGLKNDREKITNNLAEKLGTELRCND